MILQPQGTSRTRINRQASDALFGERNVLLHDARVVLLVHTDILLELVIELVDARFHLVALVFVLEMNVFWSALRGGQLACHMAARQTDMQTG